MLFIVAFQLEARSQYLVSSCFTSKSDNDSASAKRGLLLSLRPKAMATFNMVSLNRWFARHFVVYYCHYNGSSIFHVASFRDAVDSQVEAFSIVLVGELHLPCFSRLVQVR